MLAYTFIDSSTQEGLNVFNDILISLPITFIDFKDFVGQSPKNENTRFEIYKDIRRLSPDEKGIVRSVLFKAYSQGGKQGSDYAVYYFKEMINECDLANARIQL